MNARAARFGGAVLLALCAQHAFSADAPASPPPADEGLAAAQADYQAIKSSARSSTQQSLELPKLPAPILPAGADLPPPPPPAASVTLRREEDAARKQQREQERARNWLVEGVMGPSTDDAAIAGSRDTQTGLLVSDQTTTNDAAAQRLRVNDSSDGRRETDRPTSDRRSATTAKGDGRETVPDRDKPDFAGANPLDSYMAAWMTPGDRSLLLASGTARSAGDPPATVLDGPARGVAPSADVLRSSPDALSFADLTTGGRTPAPPIPAENPYLNLTNPNPAAMFVDPVPPSTTATPAPSYAPLPGIDPTPPAPPADTLADQIKARDEADRALKQLKRF